ncbi:UNVERIFIED_ORG: MerR family Zn(II)-responsive transcriptional regulator of zntA [Buttiauxella agrestis ATCC 33320]
MNHNIRTEGGFRLYVENDLQRLRFIRYARNLGFTLDSIRHLLAIRIEPNDDGCHNSKNIVQARLNEVEARLEELQAMQRSLRDLNDICCDSDHCITYCTILEALEQGAEGGKS